MPSENVLCEKERATAELWVITGSVPSYEPSAFERIQAQILISELLNPQECRVVISLQASPLFNKPGPLRQLNQGQAYYSLMYLMQSAMTSLLHFLWQFSFGSTMFQVHVPL